MLSALPEIFKSEPSRKKLVKLPNGPGAYVGIVDKVTHAHPMHPLEIQSKLPVFHILLT